MNGGRKSKKRCCNEIVERKRQHRRNGRCKDANVKINLPFFNGWNQSTKSRTIQTRKDSANQRRRMNERERQQPRAEKTERRNRIGKRKKTLPWPQHSDLNRASPPCNCIGTRTKSNESEQRWQSPPTKKTYKENKKARTKNNRAPFLDKEKGRKWDLNTAFLVLFFLRVCVLSLLLVYWNVASNQRPIRALRRFDLKCFDTEQIESQNWGDVRASSYETDFFFQVNPSVIKLHFDYTFTW